MRQEINNDEQHEKALAWLVEKATILSDPLFSGPERDKLDRTYDYVTQQILDYQRREREAYEKKRISRGYGNAGGHGAG